MLQRLNSAGLFITGTDTNVGKTLVACALADWFRRRRHRVGVIKPVATGCRRDREGLVSEDAERLAHFADAPHPLDLICPQRYAEPLAPAVAARRAGQPMDWDAIGRSVASIAASSDVVLVEGVGGVMVPLDERHFVIDLAQWLGLPAVVVAHPGLGTINHALLTIRALRAAAVEVAGVVINRYPPDGAGTAEETNPSAIEQAGQVPVLCLVPPFEGELGLTIPPDVASAIDRVDWKGLSVRGLKEHKAHRETPGG